MKGCRLTRLDRTATSDAALRMLYTKCGHGLRSAAKQSLWCPVLRLAVRQTNLNGHCARRGLLPHPDERFGRLGDFANGVPSFDEVAQHTQRGNRVLAAATMAILPVNRQ